MNLLFLLLSVVLVKAQPPVPGPEEPVMGGYDLVEYHNLEPQQDGVPGSIEFSHKHRNGFTYYFKNDANRQAFISDPDKYLPKYGGFCAWGMAWEYADEGWPWATDHMGPPCGPRDGWAILDGKLYCSIRRSYQNDFNRRQEEGRRLADQRWIEYYGSLSAGPQNNGCYSWNWQECFRRSIHTSVTQDSSSDDDSSDDGGEDGGGTNQGALFSDDDDYKVEWSREQKVLGGFVRWKWTLSDITSTSPLLVVEMTGESIAMNEYIAFGVAEQVMQGPLVACSQSSMSRSSATCVTRVGDGMGTSTPTLDPVNPTVLFSFRNATHFTLRFSASLFGFWETPRLQARVLFARGLVSGNGAPQPHSHDSLHRQAVTGIDFLSVVVGYNVEQNRPQVPGPATLEELPPREQWAPITGKSGTSSILDGRISVAWEFFSHSKGDLVMVELQNVVLEENTYVGFGFAESVMSGLVMTCASSTSEAITSRSTPPAVCKQWRGFGTNLFPRNNTDAGGWFLTNEVNNGTHVNYTLAGRVKNVLEQSGGSIASVETIRAICAIGRSAPGNGNPLMHDARDREPFQLNPSNPTRKRWLEKQHFRGL